MKQKSIQKLSLILLQYVGLLWSDASYLLFYRHYRNHIAAFFKRRFQKKAFVCEMSRVKTSCITNVTVLRSTYTYLIKVGKDFSNCGIYLHTRRTYNANYQSRKLYVPFTREVPFILVNTVISFKQCSKLHS